MKKRFLVKGFPVKNFVEKSFIILFFAGLIGMTASCRTGSGCPYKFEAKSTASTSVGK